MFIIAHQLKDDSAYQLQYLIIRIIIDWGAVFLIFIYLLGCTSLFQHKNFPVACAI